MRSVLVLALVVTGASFAGAQPSTPLLQDDLRANRRTRIDGDDDLGALFGGSGFSTKELATIGDHLRADLQRERPRATPRLVVFLYPGRVNASRLRALSEVVVDMELFIEPCERAVCREAIARHIELVGAAVGRAVLASKDFRLVFKDLRIHADIPGSDTDPQNYLVPIADCIAAAGTRGGGLAWLDGRARAEADYETILAGEIMKNARLRRTPLAGAPTIERSGRQVSVTLRVQGDRTRGRQYLLDAFAAAGSALRANVASPPEAQVVALQEPAFRGDAVHRFRAPGAPTIQLGEGRLGGAAFAETYLEEVREGAAAGDRLAFDDDEAAGAGEAGEAPPDDDAALAVLQANFEALAACARAELARNKAFRGVTIEFRWQPWGRAANLAVKEVELRGGPLARCLVATLGGLSLPRFAGLPRTIEYPIRLR